MTTLRQLRRKARLAMEATLPKPIMSLVSFLYPPSLFIPRLKQNLRLKKYRNATAHLGPDTVLLENRHALRVTPEAKESYEHFCWREERTVVEISNFLNLIKNKRCLYDIGALHGVFSFSFSLATGGQSFAFEPSPLAADVLREVLALNPSLRVTHLPYAIGRQEGELIMRMEWQHMIAASEAEEGTQRIKMQSLDAFASSNPPPDCMKVDVEGFEYEVLLGASETLKKHHPFLFLEIHPILLAKNGRCVGELVEYLHQFNYEIVDSNLRRFILQPAKMSKLDVFNIICQ